MIHWSNILCLLLFMWSGPWGVVLGQVDSVCLQSTDQMMGGESVRFGVSDCVYTRLSYSASILRSKANQSNAWNLKWWNFSSFFHSQMFVLGYSTALHSCVVNWFLTKRLRSVAGNLRACQLDTGILNGKNGTFIAHIFYARNAFFYRPNNSTDIQ